jgi:hypothetical protein
MTVAHPLMVDLTVDLMVEAMAAMSADLTA